VEGNRATLSRTASKKTALQKIRVGGSVHQKIETVRLTGDPIPTTFAGTPREGQTQILNDGSNSVHVSVKLPVEIYVEAQSGYSEPAELDRLKQIDDLGSLADLEAEDFAADRVSGGSVSGIGEG